MCRGRSIRFAAPDGNAATAVVWNPVRQLFVAAVRYHGYYQSTDGITWTRMTAQPGAGLTTLLCPTNPAQPGSIACPIFRGALAVNPPTGDTFAWTVDLNNQDQGLWQDQCAISGGACSNPTITFAQQWSTAALETSTLRARRPSSTAITTWRWPRFLREQDTLLLAGANDLWKCSLAMGCVWRNTTNSTTCMSAQVGEFQHALAWNAANPLEIFSATTAACGARPTPSARAGSACSATDASHFQNLNGSLGSLAEVESLSPVITSPYTLMAGLGVNGTAGVKGSAATADWPQILWRLRRPGGHRSQKQLATGMSTTNRESPSIRARKPDPARRPPSARAPVVTDADVGGDGDTMSTPAPFLVDPLRPDAVADRHLPRVARTRPTAPAGRASNAISPILDSGATGVPCNGDALIRSMAAMLLPAAARSSMWACTALPTAARIFPAMF